MDWTKIVDPICKVLRHYSAVPCNFFDQENARPLPLRDFNVNLIPLRSRFDSSSFRKLGAFRSARCWPGILHGRRNNHSKQEKGRLVNESPLIGYSPPP